jgi:RNA polymerase sigma factor (sigma-70 family)
MSTAPKMAREARETQWSDSRLVKECQDGNEAAWSALIDKYKNLIFSIPIRYGFPQEDSADIFQSVCMDLLVELPRLREPKALPGWLIQVTRNKCFHRRKEQLAHPTTEIEEDRPAERALMGSIIAQVEEEQLVREAMHELMPRCQQLVHMLFFESPARPYEEIAHELGLATGSIGLIRRRCLEKLRKRLEERGRMERAGTIRDTGNQW